MLVSKQTRIKLIATCHVDVVLHRQNPSLLDFDSHSSIFSNQIKCIATTDCELLNAEASMMQSRLAFAVASRLSIANRSGQSLAQRWVASRTADPDIHSGGDGADPAVYPRDPEGMDDVANPKTMEDVSIEDEHPRPSLEEEPISPVNIRASAHKLENTPVPPQGDPNFQQKRKSSTAASQSRPQALDSASCVGLDGSPWPRDAELEAERKRRDEETETDKEYYSHHKASPLAEIEIADTRKPITQATDGTAAPRDYGGGKDVIGWSPEQLDTAEDSLRRATLIFKRNAERGDPETFPHSRILREMRGEWF